MSDLNQKDFFDAVSASFGLCTRHSTTAEKPAPRFGPRFCYDGRPFALETWPRQVTQQADTPDLTRYTIVHLSPDHLLELRLQLAVHHDFPVIEWRPELRATGDTPTAIVADFQSLALNYPLAPLSGHYPNRLISLRRNLGSKNRQDDFAPAPVILRTRPPMNHVHMETDEGRSSAAWLPFFGVDFSPDEGLNFGIGWSGAWQADFALAPDNLSLAAGMMHTRFRLLPGETIRQPSIFVQARSHQTLAQGQNQLRQFILKHHSPRDGQGRLIPVPHPISGWGGRPTRELATLLDDATRIGMPFDILWVDAGWFGKDRPVADTEYCTESDWARTVGDWRVNQVPHPGGFAPLAAAVHKQGRKFLLWVEIERVMPDTPVATDHPEWLLRTRDNPGNLLLNLGDPQARDWAIETVERLVREEHIDYYRQDFNFNTVPFWREADAEDRQGICEAKFVDGLYRFWDALRLRFPDMLIDNCASGGRRIDFETMSRSICLWRADLLGRPWFDDSEVNQLQIQSLTQWVPLHAGGVNIVNRDEYAVLSGIGPAISPALDYPLYADEADGRWRAEMRALAKRLSPWFLQDFYPLTAAVEDRMNICAYQCHNPAAGDGFIMAFRRPGSSIGETVLHAEAIDANAEYDVEVFRGSTARMHGASLINLEIALPAPRAAKLIFYRKAGGGACQADPAGGADGAAPEQ
jgi:alpha-galactosidase